jgi:Photosystem I reaction centre subunit III
VRVLVAKLLKALIICPQYAEGSAPALALQATIERTQNRFANYGKAGVLCGTDGLPHLIADPGLALRFGHAGEVFVSATTTTIVHDDHACCLCRTSMSTEKFRPGQRYCLTGKKIYCLTESCLIGRYAGRSKPSCVWVCLQIPTIGFLYVAGWIGSVGRTYLNLVKSTDKEIIIDVPLALNLAWQGVGWPGKTIAELRNGTLTEKEENITVSPR